MKKVYLFILFIGLFWGCSKNDSSEKDPQYQWNATYRILVLGQNSDPMPDVRIHYRFTYESNGTDHVAYTNGDGYVLIDGKGIGTQLNGKCTYTIRILGVGKDGYILNMNTVFIGEYLEYTYENHRMYWKTYYLRPE